MNEPCPECNKPCRLCDKPLGPRAHWRHTGCFDCERLHLRAEIAEGKTAWAKEYRRLYEADRHVAMRQASEAVREGLNGPPWGGDYDEGGLW